MKAVATAIALLTVPFSAMATLITEPSTEPRHIIDVEVWGTVERVHAGDSWSVGDPVHQTWRIDTALAPPDQHHSSQYDIYVYNLACDRICPPRVPAPSGFVTAAGYEFEAISGDRVDVWNLPPGGHDHYYIDNSEYIFHELGFIDLHSIVYASIYSPDLFDTGGLVQEFDVTDPHSSSGGILIDIGGVLSTYITFMVDRMRVTPRLCKQ